MSTRPIPDKIKINWRTYTIEQDEHRTSNNGDLYGAITYEDNHIYIYDKLDADNKWVSLLHEIVHAIFYFTGHSEYRKNEDLVTSLTENLYQVLRENKLRFDDSDEPSR